MKLQTKQFRYGMDNLGYLVYGDSETLAIDGDTGDDMLGFIKSNKLDLKFVTNTHGHMDHTMGNDRLLNQSNTQLLDFKGLMKKKTIELEGKSIQVYHTPGHTEDSVVFHFDDTLISGDTLFIGKVGRCFTGDLKSFYKSIQIITGLPGNTVFYPGHDYVEEYIDYIRKLDPDNPHLDSTLKKYSPDNISSTLEDEKKINPFLRLNDKVIISVLEQRGLPTGSEYERWVSMMSII